MKTDGSIEKYKDRLVVQGFGQKAGIDFFDIYSPVAHISTVTPQKKFLFFLNKKCLN